MNYDENIPIEFNADSTQYVERYGLLMQASSECTCDFNLSTNELYLSDSFKSIFGIEPISIDQNKALYISLIHPDDYHRVDQVYKEAVDSSKEVNINIEYRLKKGDGDYAYVQDKLIVLRDSTGKAYRILNVIKDISPEYFHKHIENIEREIMELSMQDEVSLQFIVTKYIQNIEQVFPKMKASVLRIKNNCLENLASPSLPKAYIDGINGLEIGNNRGSCGTAAFTKETIIVDDIETDFRWADFKDLAKEYNLAACWSQPIFNSKKEVIATFANYYHQKKTPNKWESYFIDRAQKLLSMIFNKFEYIDHLKITNDKFKFVNSLTNDAIYEWNIINKTIEWGDGFKRIFKHTYDHNISYPDAHWNALIHPLDFKRVQDELDEFLSNKNEVNYKANYKFLKGDGTYAYVEEKGQLIRDENGRAIKKIGLLRDISEQALSSITNQLQNEISLIFKENITLKESLELLLDLVLHFSNYKTAEIWIYNSDREHINLVATKAINKNFNQFFEQSKNHTQFNKGIGIPGQTLELNKFVIWNNLAQNERFIRLEAAKNAGLNSAIGIPLKYKLNTVGVIMLCNNSDVDEHDPIVKIIGSLTSFIGNEIIRKQQEEELFLLFESSPDILTIVSTNGQFLRVNPALCKLLDYTEEELTSTPFFNFIHPDDLENTEQIYRDSISGIKKANNFINRLRTKQGNYRWLSWSTSDKFGDEGYIFAYARDITEVVELQHLLNAATSLARVGGWELDLSTKNNGVLYWSKITKEIFGVNEHYEPTLPDFYKFLKPESEFHLKESLKNLIQHHKEFDIELECITASLENKWVRVLGKPEFIGDKCVKIYGSFQDIHKQKLNELTIKESEKRYSDIFHLSPLPMWVIDVETLKFVDVNNAALEQYGYTLEEFLTMDIGNIRPKYDRGKVYELVKKNKDIDEFEYVGVWTHIRKNGEHIKADIRSKGIIYKNRKARLILASDVTERMKHLEALELQNSKLKEIAWLQSHVVRAPLARIMGLVDIILDSSSDIQTRDKALAYFKTSANELDDIIKDIVKNSQELNDFN